MTRQAVLVPGRLYGPSAPLLYYANLAAQSRQAVVEAVEWGVPEAGEPSTGSAADRQAWVDAHVAPLLDRLGSTPLLIGKSLGSYAANLAAQRSLPAVWYTPLLFDELVVAALREARAPFLLIGGTADAGAWDGALARSLTRYVCEIEAADHSLLVPSGLAASAAVLGEVTTAVERFLDEVVWPAT